MEKQVEKEHYRFSTYMTKERWCSIWHQLDEVLKLQPENVLEVGPGTGLFKLIAENFRIKVDTLDVEEELNPDIVASATEIPISDRSYDVVCSFQMLEHIPFNMSIEAIKEMVRVSRKYVIISLPDAEVCWSYSLYVPKLGKKTWLFRKPLSTIKEHEFDGEHYWEINKKGYELKIVEEWLKDAVNDFQLTKTYRVPENPYHRFFVFSKV